MGVWVKRGVSVPDRHLCSVVMEQVEIEQFALYQAFSSTHASLHPPIIYAFGRARLPFSAPRMQRWEEEKSQSIRWARHHREITVWFGESPHGMSGATEGPSPDVYMGWEHSVWVL